MTKKTAKTRLDDLLVERGYYPDTDAALRAVLAHEVRANDVYATSAALMVARDADIFIKTKKCMGDGGFHTFPQGECVKTSVPHAHFVSRGGFKLQGALDAFGQDVSGMRCIDVGSSTGGFTDCLLQAGAAQVTCVDVNYGQLAWSLRQDERVRVFERTNIKTADPCELGAPFDLIVADVSFIGLASLAPTFASLAHEGSVFIGLVKPQFESQHGETDHGVVRDPAVRERTVEEVSAALEANGFDVTDATQSPITGPKGNVEFLMRAVMKGQRAAR